MSSSRAVQVPCVYQFATSVLHLHLYWTLGCLTTCVPQPSSCHSAPATITSTSQSCIKGCTPGAFAPPADPSPRVRGLVEALLLRQLAGRRLLPGNLVGLPMFGQQALFVVEGMACAAGRAQDGAAVTQAAAADGPSAAILPPPVGASTAVHLLLGSEAAPDPAPAGQPTPQQLEDWPAQAAAAAAEALGCSLEDAGPMAARRAAAAGQASRAITFDDLGGAVVQASSLGCAAAAL